MRYRDRVAAIAALIRALPDAGVVHERSRMSAHWAEYVRHFQADDKRINGWEISRRRALPDSPRWQDTYRLRRFYGIRDQDASDLAFQESLDEAIRALGAGADLTLEDGTPWGWVADGLRIQEIEERMFGEVLVHFAECELPVTLYHHDV